MRGGGPYDEATLGSRGVVLRRRCGLPTIEIMRQTSTSVTRPPFLQYDRPAQRVGSGKSIVTSRALGASIVSVYLAADVFTVPGLLIRVLGTLASRRRDNNAKSMRCAAAAAGIGQLIK